MVVVSSISAENAPRLLPLALPKKWTVFCPESAEGIKLQELNEIPPSLGSAPAKKMRFSDYACTLDRGMTKSGPAIFIYEFYSPTEGVMQAGVGADWFWTLMINGKTIVDRLKKGNAMGPITHRNHAVYLPVKKGKNLVTAMVYRGSNGWKFAFGPVLFTVLGNGILQQDGLAATDCVLTFPDGKTARQSEALTDVTFRGKGKNFEITGTLAKGVTLSVISKEKRTKKKDYAIELEYALKSDKPFAFKKAQVLLHFPNSFAADAQVAYKGKELKVSQLPEGIKDLEKLTVLNPEHMLVCSSATPILSLQPRQGITVAATFPLTQNSTSSKVAFQITPGVPPFRITAGKKWVPLPLERNVKKGSILDFSFLADQHAPAGKFGKIISNKKGHFVYEKTGKRARLIGTNLCFDANYIPKEECDKLAEVFRRQGYNSVRFHHTDIHMIKNTWNAQNSYEVDPEMLDKLDYLFYAMKKGGLYVTVDFYTMRYFGPGEIVEVARSGKRTQCDVKALLPVSETAFNAWSKLVLAWMNHVNPYTGIAWKDDPALVFACPLNEDSIVSVLRSNSVAMKLFKKRYQEWKTKNGITGPDVTPLIKDPRFTEFVLELKRESNREISAFLKKNGINIMLSGSNWWNTQGQTFTRSEFDVVDNHQYADHPNNGSYNQGSCIRGGLSRTIPVFMMPTRIFGKPFTVTEFNFCFPNRYRAEGGALFGAYSALQDWDAVYRFSWSHSKKKNLEIHPVVHFDIASDLLSLYTDRQIALLFARGDVSPAAKKYLYAVSMKEATKEGFGGMWSRGLFPKSFTSLGVVSQTGSQVVDTGHPVKGQFNGVTAEQKPQAKLLAGNPFDSAAEIAEIIRPDKDGEIVSDTGEIRFNPKKGYLKVLSEKTECFVSFPGKDMKGICLSVVGLDTFTAVSASAMDDRKLANSKRVLIFHLTNVLNSNMKFSNAEMRRIEGVGELPHLVRTGKADLLLKNTNPGLSVYAVSSSGKKIAKNQS